MAKEQLDQMIKSLEPSVSRKEIPPLPSQEELNAVKKQVMLRLKQQGEFIDVEKIQTWKVWVDAYAVQVRDSGVSFFQKKNGEIILNPWEIAGNPYFKEIQSMAGYVEKKENGKYQLYAAYWKTREGAIVTDEHPIDPKTPEFYEAWRNLLFQERSILIFNLIKSQILHTKDSKNEFYTVPKEAIPSIVESGAGKFETFEFFRDRKMISESDFILAKEILKKNIVNQCKNEQFSAFTMAENLFGYGNLKKLFTPIHENDLKNYVTKGYIDGKTALECYKVLPPHQKNPAK